MNSKLFLKTWGKLQNNSFLRKYLFPVVIFVTYLFLSAARISGSSINALSQSGSGSLLGTARMIRSDEWNVSTPLVVSQGLHGFPQTISNGLGLHDISVYSNIPYWGWSAFFRPWLLPELVLGVHNGFAASWWALSLLLIFSIYFLLIELTNRVDVAIIFSLSILFAPFVQWWYESTTLMSIAMGCFSLLFFLKLLKSKSRKKRALWILATSWALVTFTFILYPPFQIPIAITLLFLGIGETLNLKKTLDVKLKEIVLNSMFVAVIVILLSGVFYVDNKIAIESIKSTIYPGLRSVIGGRMSITQLFSAPFGFILNNKGLGNLNLTNQSEISSFILLGPFVLFEYFRSKFIGWNESDKRRLVALSIGFILLSVWGLIGLPSLISRLLLLNTVPVGRNMIGIGFSGMLLMALYCGANSTVAIDIDAPLEVNKRKALRTDGLIAAAVAFAIYVWSGQNFQLSFPGLALSTNSVVFWSAFTAATIGFLISRKVLIGGTLLISLSMLIGSTVNPLVSGLGPLVSSSLLTNLKSTDQAFSHNKYRVWTSIASYQDSAVLEASGLPNINEVQIYPDKKFWSMYPSLKTQSDVWNRYANLSFAFSASETNPSVSLLGADSIQLSFDPCGKFANSMNLGFYILNNPVNEQCLSLTKTFFYEGLNTFIYVRTH
jgi:hypothetical protein